LRVARHRRDTVAAHSAPIGPPLRACFEESTLSIHSLKPRAPARERVLCLHSSGSSGRQWEPMVGAWGGRFEVLTPELLGYGGNERWLTGTPVSLARQVLDLLAAQLPHAARTTLAGLGHMGPVDAAPRVLAAAHLSTAASELPQAA
jgi:hypothetical protein